MTKLIVLAALGSLALVPLHARPEGEQAGGGFGDLGIVPDWSDAPEAAPPAEAPPPPPAYDVAPAPPPAAPQPAPQAAASTGQWVYTQQYGWVWMPYGAAYTYAPPGGWGEPYAYVYTPAYRAWAWVAAPWVWGIGPWPFFGVLGPVRFDWYGWGWWRTPARWRYAPHHHGGFGYRPAPAFRGGVHGGWRPAPAPPPRGGASLRGVAPPPLGGSSRYRVAPAPLGGSSGYRAAPTPGGRGVGLVRPGGGGRGHGGRGGQGGRGHR